MQFRDSLCRQFKELSRNRESCISTGKRSDRTTLEFTAEFRKRSNRLKWGSGYAGITTWKCVLRMLSRDFVLKKLLIQIDLELEEDIQRT